MCRLCRQVAELSASLAAALTETSRLGEELGSARAEAAAAHLRAAQLAGFGKVGATRGGQRAGHGEGRAASSSRHVAVASEPSWASSGGIEVREGVFVDTCQ